MPCLALKQVTSMQRCFKIAELTDHGGTQGLRCWYMKEYPSVGLSSVTSFQKNQTMFILGASAGGDMERKCNLLPQAVYMVYFPLWKGNPSLVLSLSSICCSKGL